MRMISVYKLVLAGTFILAACNGTQTLDSAEEEGHSRLSGEHFSNSELLTALRSVSLRTRLKLADANDVREISNAETSEEAFQLYSEAVDRYVYSAEFSGAMLIYFRQMFGMGRDNPDDPNENAPADLATFVVTWDRPYSELLTANYKVIEDIPIVGQDSEAPTLDNLGGFATLQGWLERWYGNGFGFNYVREIAQLVKCYRYPDPESVGMWPQEEVSAKYHDQSDSEVGINCYACHGTMNARRPVFHPYGADGLYDANRNNEWVENREIRDTEPTEFDGEQIIEPVQGEVVPRYTEDFDLDPNGFPMVGSYMRQISETEQFKTCTARRFLAFALGYESAGAPGQDPVMPFDFSASSKPGDEQLLVNWTERLDQVHELIIRPFLVDFMTSEDFILRVAGVIL